MNADIITIYDHNIESERFFCSTCSEEIRNDYTVGEECPHCGARFANETAVGIET